MYRSLENPQHIITLNKLRELYPDIVIESELSNDTLTFLEIPFRNIDPAFLREEKLEKLDNEFKIRVRGNFLTSQGFLMQFDTSDSLKMQGAIQLLEATGATEGYLTQADDTTIYHVPLESMKRVLIEMLTAYAQCHARKQALRAAINAAQNEEELNAIEITWPV